MTTQDMAFLKKFSLIIAALMLITLVLAVFAHYLHGTVPPQANPEAEARLQQRLQPAGAVYAGDTGAAAMAAAAEASRSASASQVAYDGTLDGSVIYTALCSACHTAGVAGAPKLEQAAWAARVAQGTDTLVKHAQEGYQGGAGVMPARGGNPALSDEQVRATVIWMVENLK
ncbi:MAG: cytochrome C class I [Lysobacterales bacterium CG17_big_fil_post_rev_8_21_14_2_50_64_11]|nr:MAG: cytochrome C class I [Xanthomonadales bacterium CG17_big_fil_post_rev_8_21_14_2_50_64_11]